MDTTANSFANKSATRVFAFLLMSSASLGSIFGIAEVPYRLFWAELVAILWLSLAATRLISLSAKPTDPRVHLWVLASAVAFISTLWADNQLRAFGGGITYVVGLVVYLLLSDRRCAFAEVFPFALRIACLLLTAQVVVRLALVSAQISQEGYLAALDLKYGLALPLGESNLLAFVFEFALVYEVAARRRGWLIWAVISAIGLTLTFSRAAYLMTTAVLSFLIMVDIIYGRLARATVPLVGFFVLVVLIAFSDVGNAITAFIDSLLESRTRGGSGARMMLWQQAIQEIAERPWLGYGYNWELEPHNMFLDAFKAYGVLLALPHLALVLSPIVQAVWAANRNLLVERKGAQALTAAYAVVVLHSMVEPFWSSKVGQLWLAFSSAYLMHVIRHTSEQQVQQVGQGPSRIPIAEGVRAH